MKTRMRNISRRRSINALQRAAMNRLHAAKLELDRRAARLQKQFEQELEAEMQVEQELEAWLELEG